MHSHTSSLSVSRSTGLTGVEPITCQTDHELSADDKAESIAELERMYFNGCPIHEPRVVQG